MPHQACSSVMSSSSFSGTWHRQIERNGSRRRGRWGNDTVSDVTTIPGTSTRKIHTETAHKARANHPGLRANHPTLTPVTASHAYGANRFRMLTFLLLRSAIPDLAVMEHTF